MQAAGELALERGRGAVSSFEAGMAQEALVRERIASLIGVPAEKVVMTTSTTEGCNIVVTGLRLGPEDEVVTTDAELAAVLR